MSQGRAWELIPDLENICEEAAYRAMLWVPRLFLSHCVLSFFRAWCSSIKLHTPKHTVGINFGCRRQAKQTKGLNEHEMHSLALCPGGLVLASHVTART